MATSRHTSIGLVLSGGGTRLFAHMGFLWALDDAGLLVPGQPIAAAVGNSAGSLVGAMLALGYTPREMWELAYWRIWGYKPPAEPRAWRADPRPRGLGVAVDLDFDGLAYAVAHDLRYLKGVDTGRRFEALLQRILEREGPDGRPNPDFSGTRPPEALLPLYLIGFNLSNLRETIFEYTGHCPGAPRPPLGSYPAVLGRGASYEVCRDEGDPRASPKELFRPWEGVRISTSLPLTFRPYYKPRFAATHWDSHGQPFRVVQGAYFSDGGSRDNYPLSVAIKLAGCDAVMGCFLGAREYPFRLVGTGTAIDLASRNTDGMMHALFEADQDDAEITARPVRTVVPHIPQRPGVTFDLSQIGAVMEAGYIGAAYYLRRLRPEMADADFLAALVDGQLRVSWAEVLTPGAETWGQAAGGRAPLRTGARAAARPPSDYYIVEPTQDFEEEAIRFFAERYPAVAGMAAPGSPLEEEIARRNRERREVALDELAQAPFRDAPLAQAQRAAVAWLEGLSWAAASGIIAGLATVLLAAWAVLGHLLRLVPAPDPVDMWAAELLILVIAPGLGWVLRRLLVWLVWEQVKGEIRKWVGFQ